MKRRRVCAASSASSPSQTHEIGRDEDADSKVRLSTTTAPGPLPAEWMSFVAWNAEERKISATRDRLRRLLSQTGERERDAIGIRDERPGDVVSRELVYEVLYCDASARLLHMAQWVKTSNRPPSLLSPFEYRTVVDALVREARVSTIAALGRHLVAHAVSWRPPPQTPVLAADVDGHNTQRSNASTDALACAIAAMPVACLALTFDYTQAPWQVAAVCRRWWRCVRDASLHHSHHLEFALRRYCSACATADVAVSFSFDAVSSTVGALLTRVTSELGDEARIQREILVHTVPARFRARTTRVAFGAPSFSEVPAVAQFLKRLVALRRLEIALRLDAAGRGYVGTQPLDALCCLSHLDTLRLTLEHVLDRPAKDDLHVPHLPSLTHLDCRTRALPSPYRASTGAPTLHLRCKSLRVLRLRGRACGHGAPAAFPRVEWVDVQQLEELSLDFGNSETGGGQEYELAFWAQCVDIDATDYDRATGREFRDVPKNKSTRFARSMQRLRRLAVAGHFCLSPQLATLETLRLRAFVGHQEKAWKTLRAVRSIRCRIDFMSDAVVVALNAPPSVTHVDLDVRTSRATAPQIEAMREFATRLDAAGGALTWNGSSTFPAFDVTEDEQESREDSDSGGESEFSADADE